MDSAVKWFQREWAQNWKKECKKRFQFKCYHVSAAEFALRVDIAFGGALWLKVGTSQQFRCTPQKVCQQWKEKKRCQINATHRTPNKKKTLTHLIGIVRHILARLELVQSIVGDLQHPSAVNQTVRRLKVPVRADFRVVQINHSLERW